MDEYTADAFASHDEPIPGNSITTSGDEKPQESESVPGKLRNKVKEKLHDLTPHHPEKADPGFGLSLQDRLFAKCAH